MKALVLSGGSIKGAFQAGAIDYILSNGFRPDLIYGISVGSLNGAFLVDRVGRGAGPDIDWPAIGGQLTAFWRQRVQKPEDLISKRSKMSIAWNSLRSRFDGIVGIGPLEQLVRSEIDAKNLRSARLRGTRLMAGTVNLADGAIIYADPSYPRIIDYIISSAAMPVIMPVVDVMGQPMTDGGIRDVAPLGRAINEGADEIVCILCQASRVLPKDFNRRSIFQIMGRVLDILMSEVVENDLGTVNYINSLVRLHNEDVLGSLLKPYRHVKVKVIRPADPIHYEIDAFTSSDVAEMLEVGHDSAQQQWIA